MDDEAKALWNYSIEEITAGHAEEEEAYLNISCYEGHRYAFEIHQYT